MNNDNDKLEVMPPSAIGAMERASIDSQIATAKAFPRSLESFKKRSMTLATFDTETAESCIYCRPVGKEKNERGQWVEKFAEGASIRMAEIVAASYGNISVGAQITEQTERFVRCQGVAIDMETNYRGSSECVESTVTRDGVPYSERQRALIAKVCLAKAYRDAIFRVVPRALCKPVFDAAKKVATGQGQTLEQRQKKVKAWIATLKIDEARVFAALDVKGWAEIGEDQLVTLTGLRTAISDGDVRVDEAFPPVVAEAKNEQKQPATAQAVTQAAKDKAAKEEAAKAAAELAKDTPAENPPAESAKAKAAAANVAATEPPAEAKKDLPTCKHCGQPVEDMAAHNCEQMQAAVASAQVAGAPVAATTATAEESSDALASVRLLLKQNDIPEEAFLRYATANKIFRKGQTKLADLATGKLVQIGSVFHKIVGEIAKFKNAPTP